jgi:hypothetical protein
VVPAVEVRKIVELPNGKNVNCTVNTGTRNPICAIFVRHCTDGAYTETPDSGVSGDIRLLLNKQDMCIDFVLPKPIEAETVTTAYLMKVTETTRSGLILPTAVSDMIKIGSEKILSGGKQYGTITAALPADAAGQYAVFITASGRETHSRYWCSTWPLATNDQCNSLAGVGLVGRPKLIKIALGATTGVVPNPWSQTDAAPSWVK